MPAFKEHSPSHQHNQIHSDPRNARYGAALLMVYLLMYGGFVVINALNPDAMDTVVVAGMNFALVYGFGLIISGIALTLIYSRLCRAPAAARSRKRPM